VRRSGAPAFLRARVGPLTDAPPSAAAKGTVRSSPGKGVLLLLLREAEGELPSTPPTALQGSPIEPRLGRHRAANFSGSAPRVEAYPRLYLRHESVPLRPTVFVAIVPKAGSSLSWAARQADALAKNTGTNKADKVGSPQSYAGRSLCPSSLLGRTSVFCLKRRTLEARNRPLELLHCRQPPSHHGTGQSDTNRVDTVRAASAGVSQDL
jgi:hypothetical protein